MNYFIRQATVLQPTATGWQLQTQNVWIVNGIIKRIGDEATPPPEATIIEAAGMYLSAGWFDMRAQAGEPGLEHKETLASLSDAAMAGGFTEVLLMPNTEPVTQHKNDLARIVQTQGRQLVTLHPVAAVTKDAKGTELNEMIDLHHAGAVAFSDGTEPLWHSDVLVKTLQYLQPFGGLLINRPEDTMLTRFGTMNEGMHSTLLGLKGIPALAEELMVQRDLNFLEYAGGRLHLSLLSTRKAVDLVRQAKAQGLQLTCDIAAHQVVFDDSALSDFDTNFKVNPPFRTPDDIAALWEGLADGTIDAVVSAHQPQDEESKKLEFDLADFGAIGLETAFSALFTHNTQLSIEQLIAKVSVAPRQILGLPQPLIAVEQPANLTLFNPQASWTVGPATLRSLSQNSPFLGQTLQGRVAAVFNNQMAQIFV
ncbi:dihydroorotase [Eisenibacter elegans]|jgi:dihydroorotase|uniref:dihydroorotase n=1 Tax=Eisenibacter elegans TaxID=997 RepID=UPI00040EAA0F|nr:dihydroorotase [Eisenibacter elegans]